MQAEAAKDEQTLRFAYYCSGHGYGHATRVSAFATHLLRLQPKPVIHIVSSAPQHVFSDSILLGALYRNANIDPVIVQPLAYRVDRIKSVEVLKNFLKRKDELVETESKWLRSVEIDCVLSDAAFLGCSAANAAGIPSVLVTNFTFDSVYSYLSTLLTDDVVNSNESLLTAVTAPRQPIPFDVPIPARDLAPLVEEIVTGYRCADLLLRLPGAIPIPSFFKSPPLPSPDWIDPGTGTFNSSIIKHLLDTPSSHALMPQIPFPTIYPPKSVSRSVIAAPLLVRSPNPSIYTAAGRDRLLETIGVPSHMRASSDTKILIVSFGGQIFHKPPSHSRTHSRVSSRPGTPDPAILGPSKFMNMPQHPHLSAHSYDTRNPKRGPSADAEKTGVAAEALSDALHSTLIGSQRTPPTRIITDRSRGQSVLMIPGAPPASIPNSPVVNNLIPTFSSMVIPPTPQLEQTCESLTLTINPDESFDGEGSLLPDETWIAIVCGVPKDWANEDGEDLPENFFVAPKDVYMPDLTATADVLLGKLGYGTVSECVDACTPFVYVPRPLFIEEHGLRLFLEKEGVGVELPRTAYEAGDWVGAVEEAYEKGKECKARKRLEGETGKLTEAGMGMAAKITDWVKSWERRTEEVRV